MRGETVGEAIGHAHPYIIRPAFVLVLAVRARRPYTDWFILYNHTVSPLR